MFFLVLFHTIFYFIYRELNSSFQTGDSAGHIALANRFSEHFSSFFEDKTTLFEIITESNYYPPFFHMVVGFLNIIFGLEINLQLFWIFLIFIFTLIIIYILIIELGFDKKISLYSVITFSLIPIVVEQSRLFHLEIPFIFFILLSYLFLQRSKYFSDYIYTTLFFISLGVTQLIKWYGFLYLIVPVLYIFYTCLINRTVSKVIKNIFFGVMMFLLCVLPWYITNLREIMLLTSLFSAGEKGDIQNTFSFETIFFYFKYNIVVGTFLIPVIFSILGFVFFTKKNYKFGLLLLIQILIVYLTFTFIENKNERYIFGLNMYIAFLAAYFLFSFKNKYLNFVFILYLLLGFFVSGFNQFKINSSDAKAWGVILTGFYSEWFASNPQKMSYKTVKVPISEIYEFIISDSKNNEIAEIGVSSLIDSEFLSVSSMDLFLSRMSYKDMFLIPPYYKFKPFESDYEILRFFNDRNISYIVVPENAGPDNLRNLVALNQAIDFFKNRSSLYYDLVKEIDLKNNKIQIYRIKTPQNQIKLNTCIQVSGRGFADYQVSPLNSLLLFTGNYKIKEIEKNFVKNNLFLLEITNYSFESKNVKIENLPEAGFTVCQRLGTKLRLKKEISEALLKNDVSCGSEICQFVTHNKINIENINERSEIKYTKDTFEGTSVIEKYLKQFKVIPLFENEYNELEELYSK